jgi:hypothetical protein
MYSEADITSFGSSSDGLFAFLTSSKQLYVSHIDVFKLVQIPYPDLLEPDIIAEVFFDDQDHLRLIYAKNGSRPDQITVSDSLKSVMQTRLDAEVKANDFSCPYTSLKFTVNGVATPADELHLPIFMDYGDIVNITITATVTGRIDLFSLGMSYDRLGYADGQFYSTSE